MIVSLYLFGREYKLNTLDSDRFIVFDDSTRNEFLVEVVNGQIKIHSLTNRNFTEKRASAFPSGNRCPTCSGSGRI
jgi:hypothetical protein